ncbi:MAG: acyltransferase family protein [Ilumatobacteraceae bacterium]
MSDRMGYQPGLDGVRAVAVTAVMLYHAGFSWVHGGFFGVEVFFVVSGYLITSLLLEERRRDGRVSLRTFWVRRFRRLLPALATMLLAVGLWAMWWGSAEQRIQLRRDYPWALFYSFNWGSIFSEASYWGAGSPSPLRHLWSLAVEEQWYLLWPLAFLLLARTVRRERVQGSLLAALAVSVMVMTALAATTSWPQRVVNPVRWELQSVDTNNFLYLSTFTRASGLLLGAALAYWWRPWQRTPQPARRRMADAAGVLAMVVLLVAFVVGRVPETRTYQLLLPLVTLASVALVAVVVHPSAARSQALFGARPLVAIGKRSYGLYLWSWPIGLIVGATDGSWWRFVVAMAITAPVSEACYRWIEVPIRAGGLSRWWRGRRQRTVRSRAVVAAAASSVLLLVGVLGVHFASAEPVFDPAKDTAEVEFEANVVVPVATTVPPMAIASTTVAKPTTTEADRPQTTDDSSTTDATTTLAPTTTAVPVSLPRRVVIVGDSTAHSIAINAPGGIEDYFTIIDGSVEGCSVYDSGTAVSQPDGYTRSFDGCDGWADRWVADARRGNAEVALVVIGAWDVFDVDLDGQLLPFASPANDLRFATGVQQGIDAMAAIGVKTVLLEIPCMRPQDVKGQGTPVLPERGDDLRVAHLNGLLWQIAAANPTTATYMAGPPEYCSDEAISADRGYRWDGVHAYKPGAKLTLEAIAAALLATPLL